MLTFNEFLTTKLPSNPYLLRNIYQYIYDCLEEVDVKKFFSQNDLFLDKINSLKKIFYCISLSDLRYINTNIICFYQDQYLLKEFFSQLFELLIYYNNTNLGMYYILSWDDEICNFGCTCSNVLSFLYSNRFYLNSDKLLDKIFSNVLNNRHLRYNLKSNLVSLDLCSKCKSVFLKEFKKHKTIDFLYEKLNFIEYKFVFNKNLFFFDEDVNLFYFVQNKLPKIIKTWLIDKICLVLPLPNNQLPFFRDYMLALKNFYNNKVLFYFAKSDDRNNISCHFKLNFNLNYNLKTIKNIISNKLKTTFTIFYNNNIHLDPNLVYFVILVVLTFLNFEKVYKYVKNNTFYEFLAKKDFSFDLYKTVSFINYFLTCFLNEYQEIKCVNIYNSKNVFKDVFFEFFPNTKEKFDLSVNIAINYAKREFLNNLKSLINVNDDQIINTFLKYKKIIIDLKKGLKISKNEKTFAELFEKYLSINRVDENFKESIINIFKTKEDILYDLNLKQSLKTFICDTKLNEILNKSFEEFKSSSFYKGIIKKFGYCIYCTENYFLNSNV